MSRSRESWEGPSGEACEREDRERVRRRRVTTGGEVATEAGGDVGAPSSVDVDAAAAAAAAWDCRACRKAYGGGKKRV